MKPGLQTCYKMCGKSVVLLLIWWYSKHYIHPSASSYPVQGCRVDGAHTQLLRGKRWSTPWIGHHPLTSTAVDILESPINLVWIPGEHVQTPHGWGIQTQHILCNIIQLKKKDTSTVMKTKEILVWQHVTFCFLHLSSV